MNPSISIARWRSSLLMLEDNLEVIPPDQSLFSYGADYSFTNFGLSYSMIDTIVIFSKCNGLTGRYQDKVEFRVANLNEYFDAVKD
jgi:hypothetical protein